MATKPAKIASKNGKAPAKRIVKQARITFENGLYVAYDILTRAKVSAGLTAEKCRYNTTFRHGYEVVA